MERLRDPAIRPRIRDEVAAGIGNLVPLWDTWYVAYAHTEANRHLIGKNVAQIAELRGIEPAEAVLQVLEEENGSVPTRVHNRVEGDVRYFLGHDLAMIGSDGRAVSPYGPYKNALPHPRFYGTYPRILGRYVREEPAVLTLENAVYKMSGFPAQRMGMKDRGLVKEGLTADLVVFNPDTVIDNSTWEDPHQYPAWHTLRPGERRAGRGQGEAHRRNAGQSTAPRPVLGRTSGFLTAGQRPAGRWVPPSDGGLTPSVKWWLRGQSAFTHLLAAIIG